MNAEREKRRFKHERRRARKIHHKQEYHMNSPLKQVSSPDVIPVQAYRALVPDALPDFKNRHLPKPPWFIVLSSGDHAWKRQTYHTRPIYITLANFMKFAMFLKAKYGAHAVRKPVSNHGFRVSASIRSMYDDLRAPLEMSDKDLRKLIQCNSPTMDTQSQC